jgi:hypothetical protein
LVYLRSRYYNPADGRFQTRDTWEGDEIQPITYNKWVYANANPILYTDHNGYCSGKQDDLNNPDALCWREIELIESTYPSIDIVPKNWTTAELKTVEKSLLYMTNTFDGDANFQFVFSKTIKIKRAGRFSSWWNGSTQGQSAVGVGTITLFDPAYKNDDLASFVTIHEFGHFLDARFEFLSYRDFKDKFWENCTINKDGKCLESNPSPVCKPIAPSDYAESSPKEDFAETFAGYVWYTQNNHDFSNVGAFLTSSDERYIYMENIIENIKNRPRE